MNFPNRRPVILSGCHGGGTSFVAKMLRHCGLFIGADAEPLDARKYHESRAFRKQNEQYLEGFGEKLGFSDATLLAFDAALSSPGVTVKLAEKIDLKSIGQSYWGNKSRSDLWGWKDPRNSLTAPVWKVHFPDALFVVITKKVDDSASRSPSGEWFRRVASDYARTRYMAPYWLEHWENAKSFQFESLVGDVHSFNRLLAFCGIRALPAVEFEILLKICNYEKSGCNT